MWISGDIGRPGVSDRGLINHGILSDTIPILQMVEIHVLEYLGNISHVGFHDSDNVILIGKMLLSEILVCPHPLQNPHSLVHDLIQSLN